MKSSLVALAVAIMTAAAITAARDGESLKPRLQAMLGYHDVEAPQLMLLGSIRPPQTHSSAKTSRLVPVVDPIHTSATEESADVSEDAAPMPADPRREPEEGQVVAQARNAPPAAAPAQPIDESALRYFASRGDQARLQAEISRLRALYPNWTPPADPLAIPQNGDPQLEAMWRLYSDARYAELRKAIADRKLADPNWQPPADLLERLDVAEARTRLVNASDLKQYETVISVAAATPSLLTCSEVDVLWRVAEAFADTKKPDRARDAYLYILKNCGNPAERLATIQKASAVLAYPVMQDLLSQEKPGADGTREFESLRDDLSRRFVAEANSDPALNIAPDYIARVERLTETQGLASDSLLLGWYNLRRNNMAEAEKWFRMSRSKSDSASASQGLALTLLARKAPEEAEDVMYPWRTASKDAMATYLAATANLLAMQPVVALKPEILKRVAAEVIAQKDPATAQQFGWYARALNQPQTAARWFETALAWKPDDEPSAYGLAITRKQLNDDNGVAEIQRQWAGKSERIATLDERTAPKIVQLQPVPPATPVVPGEGQPAPRQEAPLVVRYERPALPVANVRRGPRQGQVRGCATTVDPEGLPPAAALNRGWCLMALNRPLEAAASFDVALRSPVASAREDAAYGQSLAYLRAGLTGNAAAAATKAPQTQKRAAELQVAILADRVTAAFDAGRYREALLYLDQRAQFINEPIDLMVLRGYAYLNLKMYSDAAQVFEAAAATGNSDAMRGLADTNKARRGESKS